MTAASNSDARKRHAAQDAPDTLTDKLHALADTSVVLTEQERERIGERVCWHCHDRDVWSEVERIVASRVAAERERADTAEAVLREVLSEFTEKGHPGRPCLRTGWIYVEMVARWRAALGGEATP